MTSIEKIFEDNILLKYNLYNSIFTTLPFEKIEHVGTLLPLFGSHCSKGFEKKQSPKQIVQTFFENYLPDVHEEKQFDILFRFIQYVEREIVLFDAIEESAFPLLQSKKSNNFIKFIGEQASIEQKTDALKQFIENFRIRIVLTAHPTQFYPGKVLGIITDLSEAIKNNNFVLIKSLLLQLGKTPFIKHKKPSPLDEANHLIWYLENILYNAIPEIQRDIIEEILEKETNNAAFEIGFWPGGDRDGNPFVTTEITLKVAEQLKLAILKKYHSDIKKLKRRLTFKGVYNKLESLEKNIQKIIINPKKKTELNQEKLLNKLQEIKTVLKEKHQSIFINDLNELIRKVKTFGFYFASLDIRQDSRIHTSAFNHITDTYTDILPENYSTFDETRKMLCLGETSKRIKVSDLQDPMTISTIESMQAIKKIQKSNGKKGAHRYIISNTQTALNVMQVFSMLKMSGFDKKMPVDIVPLFETINDLQSAGKIMEQLYQNPAYKKHLKNRKNEQVIMLGFSDGTKDGGYLAANWSIYRAKEDLTLMARKYGIKVIFFDGRGGPPARGGGKTHAFYASLGKNIENKAIEITVQGQTISSQYGSIELAKYNLEQLLSAGIKNKVLTSQNNELSPENRALLENLSALGYRKYKNFKEHPKFIPYLEKMSTLKYYGKTKIGSRPSKRANSDKLVFSDLRAIPFVGAWSQLKQNVPGFFGVGSALLHYEQSKEFNKIENLYAESKFFKALIENVIVSLKKSFFRLTEYMRNNEEFGDFWQIIYDEYQNTQRLLLKLTKRNDLLEKSPATNASIETRHKIVLPLLTIQQYALQEIQISNKENKEKINNLEKIIVRSLFGNINASRNAV
ncbi:MAG: phosphoenolpyruvate carboxylase [Bacteroidales bacterium]|nr:phosphoenolpyruvate carboxylase [Bacteroidales bacterium]